MTLGLVATLVVATPLVAKAVTFGDGLSHVIDAANSFPLEEVKVFDGPGPSTTTLVLADGGQLGFGVTAFDTSVVNVIGGDYGSTTWVEAMDASVFTMSGGAIRRITTRDTSRAHVLGGELTGVGSASTAAAGGSSQMTISGGTTMGDVVAWETAILRVEGGDLSLMRSAGDATATLDGGNVAENLEAFSQSSLVMLSGTVGGDARTAGTGYLEIRGGEIVGGLVALETSTIAVVGEDFNLPMGDISTLTGTLTGVLADGTPLSINFGRASTASIVLLPIPEPSTLILFTVGAVGLLGWGWRRKR